PIRGDHVRRAALVPDRAAASAGLWRRRRQLLVAGDPAPGLAGRVHGLHLLVVARSAGRHGLNDLVTCLGSALIAVYLLWRHIAMPADMRHGRTALLVIGVIMLAVPLARLWMLRRRARP